MLRTSEIKPQFDRFVTLWQVLFFYSDRCVSTYKLSSFFYIIICVSTYKLSWIFLHHNLCINIQNSPADDSPDNSFSPVILHDNLCINIQTCVSTYKLFYIMICVSTYKTLQLMTPQTNAKTKMETKKTKSTALGVPRRSPIQVLSQPDHA